MKMKNKIKKWKLTVVTVPKEEPKLSGIRRYDKILVFINV